MKDSSTAIISDGKSMLYAKAGKGATASGGSLGTIPSATAFPDEAALQKALSDYLRKVSSRAPDGATLAIPTADAIFRTEFLPSADPDELAAMSLNQAEKDAPLPIEEMTQSYEILETEAEGTLVLSVCAPSAVIEKIRTTAGIDIAKVERVDALICGTIALLLSRGGLSGRGREILISEEGDNVTLAVVDSGAPVFIRSLGETAALDSSDVAKAVRLALIRSKTRRGDGAVTGFVLLGNPATLAPFANAAMALESVAPGLRARILKDDLPGGEATGVAARTLEGKSLNLFPQEWRSKLGETKFKKSFGFSIIGAATLWLVMVGYFWGLPTLLDRNISQRKEQVKRNEPAETVVKDLRHRIAIIERYSDRSFSPLEALLETALGLPPGLELTRFNYNGNRNTVQIQGKALVSTTVYTFTEALREAPIFKSVLITSGPSFNNTLRMQTFEIAITLKNAEDLKNEEAAKPAEGNRRQ